MKVRLMFLALILLVTGSAFAAGECKVCEFLFVDNGMLVFCQDARDNQVGTTGCQITWVQIGNGGYLKCNTSGVFCSNMVIEVNP
jgi:hypothetical protein